MKFVASLLFLTLTACASAPRSVEPSRGASSVEPRSSSGVVLPGFLPLHWNAAEGKIFLEVPRLGEELIYQVSLATGVGSNPLGLDRGQLGPTHVVRFERAGPRVLMVQPNQRFRALDGSAGERKAVEESFASSIIWSFPVHAETEGRLLVDATEFFLRDAHGVARRLRQAGQGSYSVDRDRSAIYPERTKAFPRNTEVEATITLVTTDRPGPLVSGVTPVAEAVTVRQHHSFVALPPPGYTPRRLDPRSGYFGVEIYDYSSPFAGPLERRYIARHRLQKKDPGTAVSEAVEPIIYYVDHAAPEPIRTALVEGASWWKEAFEKAGFRNAFEVRILPEGADPMDVRYNVINWVHRSTRGWSYGAVVMDPRTGEIIKGNVSLGSLRIRQDVMLAAGLIPPYEGPNPEVLATLDPSVSPTEMALARIRQLAAHEVGHTLGIHHNMAASTYDRGSVMDYPAPLVLIRDGRLDLSEAYGRGIGSFDVFAIRYGYAEFPQGVDEERGLSEIVREGLRQGMLFVSDEHSRGVGGAHPLGSVWDNGSDPVAMLAHEIEVRRMALERFGLGNLRPGQPLSELEPVLLPLYLHHRYQLEAALKSLGGVNFTYAVKEGNEVVPASPIREIVAPSRQREALRLGLQTLDPSFLRLPQQIVDLLPPPAFGYETGTAERFQRATSPLFDPIAAAKASAAITLNALLHPDRAARLVRHHAENSANPALGEVTAALVDRLALVAGEDVDGALRRAVREVAISRMVEVAADPGTDGFVRAAFEYSLRGLSRRLREQRGRGMEGADRVYSADRIDRFLNRAQVPVQPDVLPEIPPGPPI
jgi:hypothetical protein